MLTDFIDRGGRGVREACSVEVLTPKPPKRTDTDSEKRKKRQLFRQRAAIEPLIGHLKSDCRMERNYLWEEVSSIMNAQFSSTALNLKKYMEKLKKAFLVLLPQPIYPFFITVATVVCIPPSYSMADIDNLNRTNLASPRLD